MESKEIWKSVNGYDGIYEASSFGRVRSLDRIPNYSDNRKRIHKGKIINPAIKDNGYYSISLFKDGKGKTFNLHKLIALVHCDNPNNYKYVLHINSNRLDCRAENLKWGTQSENLFQSYQEGRIPPMLWNHTNKKHDKEKYLKALELFKQGYGSTYVSKQIEVPLRTVQNFKNKFKKYKMI